MDPSSDEEFLFLMVLSETKLEGFSLFEPLVPLLRTNQSQVEVLPSAGIQKIKLLSSTLGETIFPSSL